MISYVYIAHRETTKIAMEKDALKTHQMYQSKNIKMDF